MELRCKRHGAKLQSVKFTKRNRVRGTLTLNQLFSSANGRLPCSPRLYLRVRRVIKVVVLLKTKVATQVALHTIVHA